MSFTVNAVENGAIHVIVENSVYSVEDGAAWDGVLVDEWIDIDSDTTMMSAVVTALTENGYTQTGAEYGYISEINGLSDGWMGALNDWLTNEGYSAYTVEAGTLEAGDEIHMMYSLNWGYDVGSQWGNSDTSLAGLAFSSGALTESFNSAVTEYTLILPADETNITVTPSAVNKNFQVRTYKK
ncbi:MAG: DUF4430 domain-containing protein [Clostridiales bacterium]|nr:DUF4430 domain-containing protein [Clostridiales bacterium]